jgi:hypothetical protein
MNFHWHEATASNHQFKKLMHAQSLKNVHVRWPAKNSGAFVFGCTFLWYFLLCKQKKVRVNCIKAKRT